MTGSLYIFESCAFIRWASFKARKRITGGRIRHITGQSECWILAGQLLACWRIALWGLAGWRLAVWKAGLDAG